MRYPNKRCHSRSDAEEMKMCLSTKDDFFFCVVEAENQNFNFI